MTIEEYSTLNNLFKNKIKVFVVKSNYFTNTIDVFIRRDKNQCIITCFLGFYGLTIKNDKKEINQLTIENVDKLKEYIKTVLCIKDVDVFYRNRYRSNGKLIQEIEVGFDIDEKMIAAYSMLSIIEKNRK